MYIYVLYSRITYTPITYTLTLTIIALSFHILITHPPPWAHTFPPVFVLFHFTFHITHLIAHLFGLLTLERHCVVYGTWLFWTGWLLGVFVFSQRLVIDLSHPTTTLFWILMVERRNAWGILVWEYVGRLDQNLTPQQQPQHQTDDSHIPLRWWQIGSIRLLAFRIWCLLGTGSFWGLLYIALAKHDGYSLLYLLQVRHIFQLLLVSAAGGLMMIIFWSFWTFQYRGILWQKELRKGIVVWYSEGLAFAGDVEWNLICIWSPSSCSPSFPPLFFFFFVNYTYWLIIHCTYLFFIIIFIIFFFTIILLHWTFGRPDVSSVGWLWLHDFLFGNSIQLTNLLCSSPQINKSPPCFSIPPSFLSSFLFFPLTFWGTWMYSVISLCTYLPYTTLFLPYTIPYIDWIESRHTLTLSLPLSFMFKQLDKPTRSDLKTAFGDDFIDLWNQDKVTCWLDENGWGRIAKVFQGKNY